MPTVARENGYRLFFYSNENDEPIHIHIEKGDCVAKVWVREIQIADIYDCKVKDEKKIRNLVKKYKKTIIESWNDHF